MHLTALLPLALSLGLVLGEFCEPRSSSRRRRSHTQQRSATRKLPWWYKRLQKEGPNACVVEEVPGTDRRFYTECRYWMNRQICGQKTVLRYECCEGFERIEGRKGCTKVKPLRDVLKTAEELGAKKFVSFLRAAGLDRELSQQGAFTLFAPTDQAFDRMSGDTRSRLESYRFDPRSPVLLYHILDEKVHSSDFQHDITFPSRYSGQTIRINKFANGMQTVNCVPVIRRDQEATNGVVHLIEEALDPMRFHRHQLVDVVLQDGRFREFSRWLDISGMTGELRRRDRAYSILAPSDEAFQKIPYLRREAILADRDARTALLEHHIVPHPVCVAAITEDRDVRTLSKGSERVTLGCDRAGAYADRSRLKGDFVLGLDGIVHVLDDVLLPNKARNLMEVAESEKLTTWVEVVNAAGLKDTFALYGEYTLFVPDEAAFAKMDPYLLRRLRNNREEAKRFVFYHGTRGAIRTNQITDDQKILSLDEENFLRLGVHRGSLAVEASLITEQDLEGRNGVIHLLDAPLVPQNDSAGDRLRKEGAYSYFLRLMEEAMKLDPALLDLSVSGPSYTFFVPHDNAFHYLGVPRIHYMLDNPDYLLRVVKNHVVRSMMCSASFKDGLIYEVNTMQNPVSVARTGNVIRVNDAVVLKKDMTNTNGIIHTVDTVLLPEYYG